MKPRGDSKLDGLNEEQKKLLCQWLFEENVTYKKAQERCQSQFALAVHLDSLLNFRQRAEKERLADRALKLAISRASESATTANAKIQSLQELKDPFWAALMGQIGQDAFERRMKAEEPPEIETLKDLAEIASYGLKAKHDTQKLAQKEREINLAVAKMQFDAAREALKILPELKQIGADNALDENAKINAIRLKLFGQLPA